MDKDPIEPIIETIAETENYGIWRSQEPDGEVLYNLQLNNVTINFFQEEWEEFLNLIQKLGNKVERKGKGSAKISETDVIAETDDFIAWLAQEPDGEVAYHLELNNVTLHFFKEEWDEFLQLVRLLLE